MKTKLTQRESMVWAMAANGSRDKQIASELGLSRQRVSDILVSLRRKLGIERQGARMLVAVWYQRREEANRARLFHGVLRTPVRSSPTAPKRSFVRQTPDLRIPREGEQDAGVNAKSVPG